MREYIVSENNITDLGYIGLSTKVFESIVFFSLEDNKDVKVCVPTLKRQPIRCHYKDGVISIKVDVIVKMGCNINDISDSLLEEIRYTIEQMTGFTDVKIDLNIRGFYI